MAGSNQQQAGPDQWHEAIFVDGAFRKPQGNGTLGVRDKASGEVFAIAGLACEADVDAAVAAARKAQADWADRTFADRAATLRNAAAVLSSHAPQLRDHARDRLHWWQGRLRDSRGHQ